jgi:outer membrane protein assembly factor BamD
LLADRNELRRALGGRVNRWVFLLLTVVSLGLSTGAEAAERWKDLSPAEQYEYGERQLRRGYADRALQVFNHLRNFHRDDPVSLRAELAVADVYFRQREFEQARLAYEDFARLHPRSEQMDYVVYRTGLSIYKRSPKTAQRDQTPTWQAINTWTGFGTRFPDSEHREEVSVLLQRSRDRIAAKELSIARFYQREGKWLAVRRRAETVLETQPESTHVPEALMLAGIAYYEFGRIDEARETRERLASAFPESSELDRLDRRLAKKPGRPPEEEIFVRPYRLPSGAGGGPGF